MKKVLALTLAALTAFPALLSTENAHAAPMPQQSAAAALDPCAYELGQLSDEDRVRRNDAGEVTEVLIRDTTLQNLGLAEGSLSVFAYKNASHGADWRFNFPGWHDFNSGIGKGSDWTGNVSRGIDSGDGEGFPSFQWRINEYAAGLGFQYCEGSVGSYMDVGTFNSYYVGEFEVNKPSSSRRYVIEFPEAHKVVATADGYIITGNAMSAERFIPGYPSRHVNKVSAVWPDRTDISSGGSVNGITLGDISLGCQYPWAAFDKISGWRKVTNCDHTAIIATCPTNAGGHWRGCIINFGSTSVGVGDATGMTECTVDAVETLLATAGVDLASDEAAKWLTPRNCYIDSARETVSHRDEFQYAQLEWLPCAIEVPTEVHSLDREFFLEYCERLPEPIPTHSLSISAYCDEFASSSSATLEAIYDNEVNDVVGITTSGLTVTTSSTLLTDLATGPGGASSTTASGTVNDDAWTVSATVTSADPAAEDVTESSSTPNTCDGAPTVDFDECRSDGVRLGFTVSTSAQEEIGWRFGADPSLNNLASGTVSAWDGTVTSSATTGFNTYINGQVGGKKDIFLTPAAQNCEPTAELVCAADDAGNFAWRATIGAGTLVAKADIVVTDGTTASSVVINPGDTGIVRDGTSSGGTLVVRFADGGEIASKTLDFASCAQVAEVNLICPSDDASSMTVRVLNFSGGDDIYYELYRDGVLVPGRAGAVNAYVMFDVHEEGFYTLKAFGRNGLAELDASPSEFTKLLGETTRSFPCGPGGNGNGNEFAGDLSTNVCVDPNTSQVHLTNNSGLDKKFTIEVEMFDGSSRVVSPNSTSESTSYDLESLFPGLVHANANMVHISWDVETEADGGIHSELVRHGSAGDCDEDPPCDADGDGIVDAICDEAGDLLADIIHDSFAYATVRDLTQPDHEARTYCESASRGTETCDVRLVGNWEGWSAAFADVQFDTVQLDVSQQQGIQSDRVTYNTCDLSGPNFNRTTDCEVAVTEKAETGAMLGKSRAELGTTSKWIFQNGTINEEIRLDSREQVTAGVCWVVSGRVWATLTGPNNTVPTMVTPGVIHTPGFRQPEGTAPLGDGCFSVWLATPES